MTLAVFAYIGRKIDEGVTIRVNCLDEKRNIMEIALPIMV